jgi:hypothetical protein
MTSSQETEARALRKLAKARMELHLCPYCGSHPAYKNECPVCLGYVDRVFTPEKRKSLIEKFQKKTGIDLSK